MNVPTAKIAVDAPVLLREREKDIAILVLNRPDVRNSLSEAMLIALSSALGDIAANNTVRAVVLAASGPAFCAGHDLKELTSRRSDADGGRAYFHHIMTTCSAMMQQIVHLPKPIIAAVQGVATAAVGPPALALRHHRRRGTRGSRPIMSPPSACAAARTSGVCMSKSFEKFVLRA